jgi:hypothetical protein
VRFVVVLLFAFSAAAQTFDLTGFVAARGSNTTGPASWLDGGFGRLDTGGDETTLDARIHLGIDWTPAEFLALHASGTQDGLIEAHLDVRREIAFDQIRLRAGMFFLPTSRENSGDNWSSPYTLSFSALNTWIAHEVRPLGIDVQYRHTTSAGHAITGGATAFRGNDTMGTLLAWRGWAVGDRIAAYGEVLPLPPLGSLDDSGPFWRQRDDGTKPFGKDLDGNTGYAARLRYSVPGRGNVQYAFVDNGGDRELHGDEYSWQTRFHGIGAEAGDPERVIAAAEHLWGDTLMGVGDPFVGASFRASYLLVSGKHGRNRVSARYELFQTEDEDHSAAESNDESGRAWTLTWMVDVTQHLRAAAEFTQVTGNRPAAEQYGFTPSTTGHSTTLELRWTF